MLEIHLHQVAEIHQQINPSPWSLEQWKTCYQTTHYQNWVVSREGKILAYACYLSAGPQVELLNIGVAQNSQGQGLGEAILGSSLLMLPEDAEACFLEVRRSNIPAINLYKKLGYCQIAERKNYYRHQCGVVEDALIFRKTLAS